MDESERKEARTWTIIGSVVLVVSMAGLLALWFGVL